MFVSVKYIVLFNAARFTVLFFGIIFVASLTQNLSSNWFLTDLQLKDSMVHWCACWLCRIIHTYNHMQW